MNVNPDARHALGDKSLRIWRLVAASRKGQTMADLVDRLKGVYDEEVIKNTLGSLRQSKYCEAQGLGRGSRTVITGKLPLGEELPAWWLEQDQDETRAAAPLTTTGVPSVFHLGTPATAAAPLPGAGHIVTVNHPPKAVAARAPAPPAPAAAAVRAKALFSLDSAGRLRIEAVGTQVLQLDPDATRALFRWLDQLGGTNLQHLVEREAA